MKFKTLHHNMWRHSAESGNNHIDIFISNNSENYMLSFFRTDRVLGSCDKKHGFILGWEYSMSFHLFRCAWFLSCLRPRSAFTDRCVLLTCCWDECCTETRRFRATVTGELNVHVPLRAVKSLRRCWRSCQRCDDCWTVTWTVVYAHYIKCALSREGSESDLN